MEVNIKNAVVIDDNTISIIYQQTRTRQYISTIPHYCQLGCFESNYDTCVRDYECEEAELFHMIIDKNGDQNSVVFL